MTFNFNNSKKLALNKKDKSNIRAIDEKIRELCKTLNTHRDYFTTSSCSGRIVVIKNEEKKQPDMFLLRSHDIITLRELKKSFRNDSVKNNESFIFKQEPTLIVVACKNKECQWKLFSFARNNGWKKSGILTLDKKYLVELMSTENISFPIVSDNELLVNDVFLSLVIKKANQNLQKGWEKIIKLKNKVPQL